MPLPDRPVANTTIDSEWGQAVHDWTFAPKGFDVYSTSTTSPGTTPGVCYLDLVYEDPAGFLDAANNRVEVPTGGEGLYYIDVRLDSVNGGSGTQTRVWLYLNGSAWRSGIEDTNGGTHVIINTGGLINVTAGDLVQVLAQRRGTGTDATVKVLSLQMLRIGNEFGA